MAISIISTMKQRLETNDYIVKAQLKGFSDADALLQPAMRGNCANWILGHIIHGRSNMLERMGQDRLWGDDEAAMYAYGSQPITDVDCPHIPLAKLLEDWDCTQEKLIAHFDSISDDDLDVPYRDGKLYQNIDFLIWHEAYHAGQFEYLRQLTGADDQVP